MALKMVLTSLDGLEAPIAALYKERDGKFELQVEGAKSQIDVDKLVKAANDEREVSKGLKAQLAKWGDLNPDEAIPLLNKVPELEVLVAAGKNKLDEKQIEVVLNGRLKPVQDKLDAALKSITEKDTALNEYKAKETRRTVFDEVRRLATESKANPESFSSEFSGLMLLSDKLFTVNDKNEVITRDGIPSIVGGVRAADVWGDLQKSHSYFWPQSQGGGAPGAKGGNGDTSNPFKSNDFQARTDFIKKYEKVDPGRIQSALAAAGLKEAHEMYSPQK